MAEVDETIKSLQKNKGVEAVSSYNVDGVVIRSTMNKTDSVDHASHVSKICTKSRHAVTELDPSNELTFMRIRTRKSEMMLAPDKEFIMEVIQKPS